MVFAPSMASTNSTSTLLASSAAVFATGVLSGAALYAAMERRNHRRALASTKPLNPRDPSSNSMHHPVAGLADLITRYQQKLYSKDVGETFPVRPVVKPGSVYEQIPGQCPEAPESYAAIFKDCEDILLPGLTHWASPNFFAYFKAHGSEPSALAEMLSSVVNVVGFSWTAAPAATELEQAMCDWMARLMNLPECFLSTSPGGGVIQGSASESLLCGMIAARNRALEGLEGAARAEKASRLVMYISDQTHSIGEKGCMVLDLPHLRVIPTRRGAADPGNYGLHPDDVAAAMAKDVAAGLVPFMLVPTVGTTSTTAIDPVRPLVEVARAQGEPVWVHVDGAFGGAATVCPEFQHWFDGVEDVDSLCVNAHKWLLMPVDCSLMWVKDRRPLLKALALTPEYLKNDFMTQVNYKDWQIQLTHRFRALKIWFTLRRFGATGMRNHIRRSIGLAKRAESLLLKDGRFQIFTPVRMSLVCFYVAFGGRELNEALLRRVNDSGKMFLIHSVVDGVHFLRLAVGGVEVDEWNIDHAVEVLSESLTALVESSPKWRDEYMAYRSLAPAF
ncbi:hypothetical protein Poli38472_009146 [Pythium oligandrum]|uniref:Tyrosine decarboxylase n=1 Tax=Pythium oligandrum TaxID=41045 RepID=A0A8K1FL78_PYTOL|nr:hypothetical protein Poli38472_009146 [Pythium oligandrum]|eukprot:TMW64979.1 hypothetical protein Poli38472_009146 [Pythium oligandrum]